MPSEYRATTKAGVAIAGGRRPRVLAFESWDDGSHRAVRESISQHGQFHWHWVTLPRGHWRWRMRLGAAALVQIARDQGVLGDDQQWDAIFVTSLCSVSDLAAMLPSHLSTVPRVLYMHENQAAYPCASGREDQRDHHLALTNLTSMLASQCVLWNSNWNRQSFVAGIEELLTHEHEGLGLGVLDRSLVNSKIAWPPVEATRRTDRRVLHNANEAKQRGLSLVVWPHRWEHDKGPEELMAIEHQYGAAHRLGWVVCGQQFQQQPEAFEALQASAGDRLIHAGWLPRQAYETWLWECDWVLSTATHEFFGIAVVEAMLAGCLPWLPARLSYPELLPEIAVGLSPMHPTDHADIVTQAIGMHLADAAAPAAVARIEAAITGVLPEQSASAGLSPHSRR